MRTRSLYDCLPSGRFVRQGRNRRDQLVPTERILEVKDQRGTSGVIYRRSVGLIRGSTH